MSTRCSPTHQAPAIPSEFPEAPTDLEEQQVVRKWISQILTIRDDIAPLIIANAVHQGDDWVDNVVEFVKEHCRAIRDDIQRLDLQLHQQGIDTEVLCPDFRGPDSRDGLSNAIVTLSVGYARAGYMLGVAVGMRLGGRAFDAPERRR